MLNSVANINDATVQAINSLRPSLVFILCIAPPKTPMPKNKKGSIFCVVELINILVGFSEEKIEKLVPPGFFS